MESGHTVFPFGHLLVTHHVCTTSFIRKITSSFREKWIHRSQLYSLMTWPFFFRHPGKTWLLCINSFCLKPVQQTGDNWPATGMLQATGKTQVFDNGKTSPILPGFNPREQCLQCPHFILLRCIIPLQKEKTKQNTCFLNHKTWLLVNLLLTWSPTSRCFNLTHSFASPQGKRDVSWEGRAESPSSLAYQSKGASSQKIPAHVFWVQPVQGSENNSVVRAWEVLLSLFQKLGGFIFSQSAEVLWGRFGSSNARWDKYQRSWAKTPDR